MKKTGRSHKGYYDQIRIIIWYICSEFILLRPVHSQDTSDCSFPSLIIFHILFYFWNLGNVLDSKPITYIRFEAISKLFLDSWNQLDVFLLTVLYLDDTFNYFKDAYTAL